MRDYVRLVKDLRGCNRGGVCSECSYDNLISECISAMEKDAADAIEELLAKNNELWIQLHVEGRSLISEPPKEVNKHE